MQPNVRRSLLTTLVPLALAVAAPLVLASGGGGDPQKSEAPLTRPAGAPDADAHGKVRVEHDADKNRDKLNVEIEDVSDATSFELWMKDGLDTFTLVGALASNGLAGEKEIEFDTKDGPPLPFGAAGVADLEGRGVEVRAAGVAYLEGSVPSLTGGGGGGGGGGNNGGGGSWDSAKSQLSRPAGAPDSDAMGRVEIRRKASQNRERFQVEIEHVASTGIVFSVFLDDGLGTFVNVGALAANGNPGEFEIELDTGDGDALPFGVTDVETLAGRAVQIRGDDTFTYLAGEVPSLGASLKKDKAKSTLVGTPGKVTIEVASEPKKPNEKLEISVKNSTASSLDVFIAEPTTLVLTKVATIVLGGNGNGKLELKTKKGQLLPFGVANVADLSGLAIELRDTTSLAVVFTGTMPTM